LTEREISARFLAKEIGTSALHMSCLINGRLPLTKEGLLKISGALKVPTNEIARVELDKKFMARCDDICCWARLSVGSLKRAENLKHSFPQKRRER